MSILSTQSTFGVCVVCAVTSGVLQKKKGKSKKGSGKKKGGDAPADAAGDDETTGMTREQVTCSLLPPPILLHQLSSDLPLAFRALAAF